MKVYKTGKHTYKAFYGGNEAIGTSFYKAICNLFKK